MPIIDNQKLYDKVKLQADTIYKKSSAYKSGYIVKEYKKRGGEYSGKKTNTGLTRWYKEQWKDVGDGEYPVFRPTIKISSKTPLLPSEISNLPKQIKLKQIIKGHSNLPPFKSKRI